MTNTPDDSGTLFIQEIENANAKVARRWQPSVGAETVALFEHLKSNKKLDDDAQEQVIRQSTEILGRCVPPTDAEGQDVGLAIGYVQSGKTLSFTTVTALARDNNYPVIIVLAGTSVPLFNQSRDRLSQDLRCSDSTAPNRGFLILENPRVSKDAHTDISKALRTWNNPNAAGRRRTLLILVMKNVKHLIAAREVMRKITQELQGKPVLIIDDEADQASLNHQVHQGSESPTYDYISQLRRAIPHHTYIQYTATPQAPLLINVIDTLSPRFCQVLTPGQGYTGGATFFIKHPELVRVIPEQELPTRDGPPSDVPSSLLQAMRLFYLGVAAAYAKNDQPSGNRSMMVHPAVKREVHEDYKQWVKVVSAAWVRLLEAPDTDPGKADLLADFKVQYGDLAATVGDLPPFDQLAKHLHTALEETSIIEVNAKGGKTPQVNWKQRYPWILVGGTALDRGFTVEGLTVTYMPREGGLGNADTIQQRARFFGYKRSYLGFCRVYLPADLLDQYKSYVLHEENVRTQLVKHILAGKPLNLWKRAFLLDGSLRPTRNSVLDLDYYRTRSFSDRWTTLKSPHRPDEAITTNRETVRAFRETLDLQPFKAHPQNTAAQTHRVAHTTLKDAYENLLVGLRWGSPQDTAEYMGSILNLQNRLFEEEQGLCPATPCTVYEMSSGTSRRRALNGGHINNLYQGKNPATQYPGDQAIREPAGNAVTVQIHRLKLEAEATPGTGEDDPGTPGATYEDVYTVAIYASFGHGTYQQEDPTP